MCLMQGQPLPEPIKVLLELEPETYDRVRASADSAFLTMAHYLYNLIEREVYTNGVELLETYRRPIRGQRTPGTASWSRSLSRAYRRKR